MEEGNPNRARRPDRQSSDCFRGGKHFAGSGPGSSVVVEAVDRLKVFVAVLSVGECLAGAIQSSACIPDGRRPNSARDFCPEDGPCCGDAASGDDRANLRHAFYVCRLAHERLAHADWFLPVRGSAIGGAVGDLPVLSLIHISEPTRLLSI